MRFDWQNPHVIIAVETKGPNGELVTWTIETVYTSALLDAGWTRDSLKVGDQVTVSVNPHVDPSVHFANLNSVTKADGTILSPRRSGPASGPGNLPAPEGETNRVK